MTRHCTQWSVINNDVCIANTLNLFKEILGYTTGFVFRHIRIYIKYTDYLICENGTGSSRTLPWGMRKFQIELVILMQYSQLLAR